MRGVSASSIRLDLIMFSQIQHLSHPNEMDRKHVSVGEAIISAIVDDDMVSGCRRRTSTRPQLTSRLAF